MYAGSHVGVEDVAANVQQAVGAVQAAAFFLDGLVVEEGVVPDGGVGIVVVDAGAPVSDVAVEVDVAHVYGIGCAAGEVNGAVALGQVVVDFGPVQEQVAVVLVDGRAVTAGHVGGEDVLAGNLGKTGSGRVVVEGCAVDGRVPPQPTARQVQIGGIVDAAAVGGIVLANGHFIQEQYPVVVDAAALAANAGRSGVAAGEDNFGQGDGRAAVYVNHPAQRAGVQRGRQRRILIKVEAVPLDGEGFGDVQVLRDVCAAVVLPGVGPQTEAVYLDGVAVAGQIYSLLQTAVDDGGVLRVAGVAAAHFIRADVYALMGRPYVALVVVVQGNVGIALFHQGRIVADQVFRCKLRVYGQVVGAGADGTAVVAAVGVQIVVIGRGRGTGCAVQAAGRRGRVADYQVAANIGAVIGDVNCAACAVGRIVDQGVVPNEGVAAVVVEAGAICCCVFVDEVVLHSGRRRTRSHQVNAAAIGRAVVADAVAVVNDGIAVDGEDTAAVTGGRIAVNLVVGDDGGGVIYADARAIVVCAGHITPEDVEAVNGRREAGRDVNHPPLTFRIQEGWRLPQGELVVPAAAQGDVFVNVDVGEDDAVVAAAFAPGGEAGVVFVRSGAVAGYVNDVAGAGGGHGRLDAAKEQVVVFVEADAAAGHFVRAHVRSLVGGADVVFVVAGQGAVGVAAVSGRSVVPQVEVSVGRVGQAGRDGVADDGMRSDGRPGDRRQVVKVIVVIQIGCAAANADGGTGGGLVLLEDVAANGDGEAAVAEDAAAAHGRRVAVEGLVQQRNGEGGCVVDACAAAGNAVPGQDVVGGGEDAVLVEDAAAVCGGVGQDFLAVNDNGAGVDVEGGPGDGRIPHTLAAHDFGNDVLREDGGEIGCAIVVEEAAAQLGCAAEDGDGGEYGRGVQIVNAAAGIFIGRAAAQPCGIAVLDGNGFDDRLDIAADVDAASLPFGVNDGGGVGAQAEIAVPAALDGQGLGDVDGLADGLAAHVYGVDAAADAGDEDGVGDGAGGVNGVLDAAVDGVVPLGQAAGQFVVADVVSLVGGAEVVLEIFGERGDGVAGVNHRGAEAETEFCIGKLGIEGQAVAAVDGAAGFRDAVAPDVAVGEVYGCGAGIKNCAAGYGRVVGENRVVNGSGVGTVVQPAAVAGCVILRKGVVLQGQVGGGAYPAAIAAGLVVGKQVVGSDCLAAAQVNCAAMPGRIGEELGLLYG